MASASKPNPEIGILGYAESAYEKKTSRTLISMLVEVARKAVASAGLKREDIDGIAVCSFMLPPDNAVTLAEQLGIPISWAYFGTAGGAGPVASVLNAARAIEAGHARNILCLAADNYDVAGHYKLMDFFNRALINYGTPNGFGGANGLFGIVQRKHMETYGTRREELGRIAVGQRASAQAQRECAAARADDDRGLSQSRAIADPIRLYDCVLPCAGADAVVVVHSTVRRPAKASECSQASSSTTIPAGEIAPLRGGWELYRDRLWADAGYGPTEMDFVQAYDDYPIMVAIQIEDHGFCRKGEVGRFLAERTFSFDGSLPLNTNGGQLSCGQAGAAGGMIGLVEAVRQLRGEAGPFGVTGARRGLVSGYGMVGYGHGLSSSSIVLER